MKWLKRLIGCNDPLPKMERAFRHAERSVEQASQLASEVMKITP